MAKPPKAKTSHNDNTRTNTGIRHRKNPQSAINLVLMGKGIARNFHKNIKK